MTYEQAIEYIHGINWTFCKPGLERIGELCERLGHPERDLRFIHVAGTNGKGSFCAMTESVLRAAGYKVGLYTSPYILNFCERMQVDGKNISHEALAKIAEYVKPIADSMADKPTEFELITAVAFEYFKRERCDIVVLEAGLGGRLDSTNIIRKPLLSVITGIALDHTAILGDTVEKIAAEKAGIIKDSAPVLYGGDDELAGAVISGTASERGSEFFRVNYDALHIKSATLDGCRFDFGSHEDVNIRLLGLYQPRNAAVVLSAIDVLRKNGLDISEEAVKCGLEAARWHARFEIVGRDPLTVFDGAHNPQGIAMAASSIEHYFSGQKVCLLTGVLRDKDYTEIAKTLAAVASKAFTITPDSPRALDGREYASVLASAGLAAEYGGELAEAFAKAREYARANGMPLICLGSLYVYVSLYPYFDNH